MDKGTNKNKTKQSKNWTHKRDRKKERNEINTIKQKSKNHREKFCFYLNIFHAFTTEE